MKTYVLKCFIVFAFISLNPIVLAETKTTKATKAQTEVWLNQHIVAWDDSKRVKVNTSNCKLHIESQKNSTVMNFKGILFPIEIIAKDRSQDPFIRVRFKDRYSGNYGFDKKCNSSNSNCQKNIGKWSPVSYYDFRITNVVQYVGRDEDLNVHKAKKLNRALTHYAKLCNAKEYNFTF